ncbi:glycosyltransferase family 2 protein [Candidatus Pelagibacter sp.]|nr:glycosyltransferase family 2 protein [Candidatus Pelagibacter sp.]
MNLNKITIIVPCFNEENHVDKFIDRLQNKCISLKYDYEIIFVEDGSTDQSFNIIKNKIENNPKLKLIKLSKNYGFHIAVSAGIDHVINSELIIVCPLDDIELTKYFEDLIEKFYTGCDIVWMVREKRKKTFVSKFFAKTFYKLFKFLSGFNNYPENGTSALFLISKRVAEEFKKFKEANRVTNTLLYSMGFKQGQVKFDENDDIRKSSYTFVKKLKIAIDSIVSNSYMPMRIMSLLGLMFSFFSFIYLFFIIKDYFFNNILVEGWASIIIIVTLLGGIQLLTLGILGEYLWRTSNDSKRRPLYLLDKTIGFKD